jgi:hypothetical protein
MLSFLRWPKRFQVRVRGTNFSTGFKGESKPIIGFYTTRWSNGFDSTQAREKAFASVRQKLRERGFDSMLATLSLEVDEISEVGFWTKRWTKPPGFAFYPKGDD